MPPLKPEEEFLDVLQNIEFGIVKEFRRNGSLLDLDAKDAVAALIRLYRAEQEHRSAPNVPLGDAARRIFDSVRAICEWRLGRTGGMVPPEPGPPPGALNTPEEITLCLKRIERSIELWNKRAGRQGYLSFVAQYVR
jgi:hypothetical protein